MEDKNDGEFWFLEMMEHGDDRWNVFLWVMKDEDDN